MTDDFSRDKKYLEENGLSGNEPPFVCDVAAALRAKDRTIDSLIRQIANCGGCDRMIKKDEEIAKWKQRFEHCHSAHQNRIAEIAKLKNDIANHQAEADGLEASCRALEKALGFKCIPELCEIQERAREIVDLELKLEAHDQLLNNTGFAYEKAQKKIAELEANNKKLLETSKENFNKVIRLKDEIAELKKALEKRDDMVGEDMENIAKLTGELKRCETYRRDFADRLIKANLRIGELESLLDKSDVIWRPGDVKRFIKNFNKPNKKRDAFIRKAMEIAKRIEVKQ